MSRCRSNPILLRHYVAPHGRAIAWGVLLSLLTVGLNTGIPFISRFVVDGLAAGDLGWLDLARWLGIYAGATVVVTGLSYWMRQVPLRVGHQVEADIRRDLFDHLTELDRGYFRAQHTGDLMNRLSTDVRSVGMGVGQGLMQNSRMVFVFVLAFGVMFRLNAALAGMILLLVPLMVGSFAWFANRSKRGHLAVQEELSEMASFNQEAFTGIQTIKSFGLEPRWLELFRRRNESLMGRNLRLAYLQESLRPLAGFWFALSSVVVLLAGGRMVIQERLTLGELVQFTQYLLYMQWPLLSLGWVLGLMQRAWGSWERIRDVLEREPAIADPESAPRRAGPDAGHGHRVRPCDAEGGGHHAAGRHVPGDPGGGAGGDHGADGERQDGAGVAAAAAAGRGVGGGADRRARRAGDSAGGTARMDRHGGAGAGAVLRHAGEQPIGFGSPEATEAAILTAADLAHLHADIEQFPDRYATRVGERGVTLSGGQRQRTSIGRALARDPRILILDDVLASVDTETEAEILGKLQGVFSTRTTLLASHRIGTLAGMDWIVVVEGGRITQRGTHGELVRQPGYYRRLHEMQQLAAAI
jgi:ATP-binding cassette, subfamily B, multidrug efflux pump